MMMFALVAYQSRKSIKLALSVLASPQRACFLVNGGVMWLHKQAEGDFFGSLPADVRFWGLSGSELGQGKTRDPKATFTTCTSLYREDDPAELCPCSELFGNRVAKRVRNPIVTQTSRSMTCASLIGRSLWPWP